MSFIKELNEFAVRGNVVDLAVGVIIGGAFAKVVSSMVSDVLMPPIGVLVGGGDFSTLAITLKGAGLDAAGRSIPAVLVSYGKFANTVINFGIVAICIFMVIKGMNAMKKKPAAAALAAPPEPTQEEQLLAEIRDILKARS